MNRWFLAFVVWALLAVVGAPTSRAGFDVFQGDKLKLGDGAGTPGGIFTVDMLVNGYGGVDFYTMCVEITQSITLGNEYIINNVVQSTNPLDPNNGIVARTTGKLLSAQTAWLFTMANSTVGVLPLYGTVPVAIDADGFFDFPDLSPHTSTTSASNAANALQLGIWLGMGWTAADVDSLPGIWDLTYRTMLYNTYLDRSPSDGNNGWLDMFAADVANNVWGATQIGDVRVMNLVKTTTTSTGEIKISHFQDQLVLLNPPPGSSVPELPTLYTSTALLAGALVCGVISHRRKLRLAPVVS